MLRISSIERPDSRGFEAKRPSARGMRKRVPLKSYAPNTIHAFDCCHVYAEKAKIVLKSPRVNPAAACGMQEQSRIRVRAVHDTI